MLSDAARAMVEPPTEARLALLQACQAALAWVDAMERDDGTVDLDQQYWRWVHRMRAAVGNARSHAPR